MQILIECPKISAREREDKPGEESPLYSFSFLSHGRLTQTYFSSIPYFRLNTGASYPSLSYSPAEGLH